MKLKSHKLVRLIVSIMNCLLELNKLIVLVPSTIGNALLYQGIKQISGGWVQALDHRIKKTYQL